MAALISMALTGDNVNTDAARGTGSTTHISPKKGPGTECGQRGRVGRVGILDHLHVALDQDEKRVAILAFAHDPRAGLEVVHKAFLREQVLGVLVRPGQDRNGGEGVEERGGVEVIMAFARRTALPT